MSQRVPTQVAANFDIKDLQDEIQQISVAFDEGVGVWFDDDETRDHVSNLLSL